MEFLLGHCHCCRKWHAAGSALLNNIFRSINPMIVHYMRRYRHLLIGENSEKQIKKIIRSAHKEYDNLKVEVKVATNPVSAIAEGTGKCLDDAFLNKDLLYQGGRVSQMDRRHYRSEAFFLPSPPVCAPPSKMQPFYWPMTVTTMVRFRDFTSHSRKKICCQVPRMGRPSPTGIVTDGPSNVACKWEWPLPSCQACS